MLTIFRWIFLSTSAVRTQSVPRARRYNFRAAVTRTIIMRGGGRKGEGTGRHICLHTSLSVARWNTDNDDIVIRRMVVEARLESDISEQTWARSRGARKLKTVSVVSPKCKCGVIGRSIKCNEASMNRGQNEIARNRVLSGSR